MAYGDSEIHQGQNNWDKPTAGKGQGNGASLQIWALVSSLLFDIMRQEGFICMLTKEQWAMARFAFVDDTDLIVNDMTNQVTKLHDKMQQMLTLWHKLLQATGRDLVPDKCFWYLLDFKWEQNKWRYKNSSKLPSQLMVKNEKNNTITIPHLEPLDARCALGVWIAPDSNDTAKANHQ